MKYLISETTKEERIDIVNKALAISLSGAGEPSQEVRSLADKYIEGELELDVVQKMVIDFYKQKGGN